MAVVVSFRRPDGFGGRKRSGDPHSSSYVRGEGNVVSYADVAAGIGKPKAHRAAASACAANRLAVLAPCHRVLRGDGGLGGYRWGVDRKRALLDMERAGRPEARKR
ncbi:methylated-DNA--[protein]-cysteine S-methyltransferase [Methylosinus sp. RM1]|uniref:methylated-DNA--[protein]-cysteine S-methyltransferase n=1 Tax=Methylosinus sp. RM1 TaxID=2583817 RepID=UPI00351A1850